MALQFSSLTFVKYLFIYLAASSLRCDIWDLVPWPGIIWKWYALSWTTVQSCRHPHGIQEKFMWKKRLLYDRIQPSWLGFTHKALLIILLRESLIQQFHPEELDTCRKISAWAMSCEILFIIIIKPKMETKCPQIVNLLIMVYLYIKIH